MKSWVLIGVLVVSVAGAAADDPVVFRREVVPADRLASELDPARRGPLVRLTRDEFENRVRRATARRSSPQLLSARYEARRVGADLVGTGRWIVRQSDPQAGLLSLDPLDIALTTARWSDNSVWVAGELDRSADKPGMDLLVEPGERTAEFTWSARGRDGRWELRWPACAINVLTLDLPAGMEPIAAPDQGVRSGPTPVPNSDLWRWTLAAGAGTNVSLLIREAGHTSPTLFTHIGARFELHPRQADVAYAVEITSTGGRFREINLEYDASLRLIDIQGPGLVSWAADPTLAGASRRTRVALAADVNALSLTCIAQTAIGPNGTWRAPAISVVGAVSTGETIGMSVPPEVGLDDWRDGAFRRTAARCSPAGALDITLEAPIWNSDGGRPSCQVRATDRGVDLAQHLRWHVEPERMRLEAAVDFTPHHESLVHWELRAPVGWEPESVESRDADCQLTWATRTDEAGHTVIAMDFVEPVPLGTVGRLFIRMVGRPPNDEELFPELTAPMVRIKSVALEVLVNPMLAARFHPAPGNVALAVPAGPYEGPAPDALFFAVGAAPGGKADVRARPGRFTAECATTVAIVDAQTQCTSHIQLLPEGGALEAVTLRAAGGPVTGTWKGPGPIGLRAAVPLDVLTNLGWALAASPWAIAAAPPVNPDLVWRLQFSRPVTGPTTLEFAASLPLAGQAVAPLWSVDGATRQQQSFTLHDPTGEFEPAKTLPGRVLLPRRVEGADHPRVKPEKRTATVMADGRWLHQYCARVRNPTTELTFKLPEVAELLVVRIDMRDSAAEVVESGCWRLPVQAGHEHFLEVYFAMPGHNWVPMRRLDAVEPTFAGPAPSTSLPYHWNLPERLLVMPNGLLLKADRTGPVPDEFKKWADIPTATVVGTVSASMQSTLWVIDRVSFLQCSVVLSFLAVAICFNWGRFFGKRVMLAGLLVAAFGWSVLPSEVAWGLAGPALIPPLWVVGQRLLRSGVRLPLWLAPSAVLIAVWSSLASDSPPTTVLIVPGQPDAAYAPAELLDRLDELANAGGPRVGSAIVAARYTATTDDATCRIDAHWDVHVFRAGAMLELPATGARFEDLRVADRPAFPQLLGEAMRLALPTAGPMRVTAKMVVAVNSAGVEKSVRLTLPPCPQTHLDVTLPPEARWTQPPTGRGTLHVDGPRVVAELGAINATAWSWTTGAVPRTVETAKFSESYLWDFLGPTARLLAAFEVPAGIRAVQLVVPENLALRSAREKGSKRGLDIAVAGNDIGLLIPADSGAVTILAEFVPRGGPLTAAQPLPFPACASAVTTHIGWRGRPGEITPGPARGVTNIKESTLQQFFPIDGPTVIRAYRPATGGQPASIRVQPTVGPTWRGTSTFRWRLVSQAAYLTAEFHLIAARDPAAWVEWDVPSAVQISDITGPGVARWTRLGDRLQVWLDQPRADVRLTWTGYVARAKEEARFETPVIRGVRIEGEREVNVSARSGWELAPVAVQQLTAVAGAPTGRSWTYRGNRPAYRLLLQPRMTAAAIEFRLDTTIDEDAGRPRTTTAITAHVRRGDVRNFAVLVRADVMDEVRIDAPNATISECPASSYERAWMIDLPPGIGESYRATIVCRPSGPTKTWELPGVSVDISGLKPAAMEHWLTLKSRWNVRSTKGLLDAGVAKWRVTSEDWPGTVEALPR